MKTWEVNLKNGPSCRNGSAIQEIWNEDTQEGYVFFLCSSRSRNRKEKNNLRTE